jgi:hypothetical protein
VPLKEELLEGMKSKGAKKSKRRSPAEVVAGLSAAQRSTLRARAEEIIAAIDEYESENEEEESDVEI